MLTGPLLPTPLWGTASERPMAVTQQSSACYRHWPFRCCSPVSSPGPFAPLTWPPLSGRQVLLFHASACGELTPPLHRAPPGQHAGHPRAESTPARRAFVPGALRSPGFDAIVPPIDASAVVHTRSSSRRPPDPLTAGLFPQRSPPRLLTGAACGGLSSPPARRTRRAKPPSLAQHGSRRRPSTSPPLSGHTAERRIRRSRNSRAQSYSAIRLRSQAPGLGAQCELGGRGGGPTSEPDGTLRRFG